MRMRLLKFVLVFFVLALPAVSFGQLITIQISGHVTYVEDTLGHLENKIHVNDIFTGTYTYDSTAIDVNPSFYAGDYLFKKSFEGIHINFAEIIFATDSTNVVFDIGIRNNASLNQDIYGLTSRNNCPLSNGATVQYISWQLNDSSGTVLSSDSLPLTAPDLSKWSSQYFHISTDRDFEIQIFVTSAVPEPATLLLSGLGLVIIRKFNYSSK